MGGIGTSTEYRHLGAILPGSEDEQTNDALKAVSLVLGGEWKWMLS